ncbi:unnamed protein product [Leptosia nina]|uniref:Uncharacterized protein n=1 Tax=Leptosia nina TaxID=320188 RepID=A0AAV1J6Y8_9NEOP
MEHDVNGKVGKKRDLSSKQYSLYDDPVPGCSWMDPYQYQNINEARSTNSSDEYLKMAIPESLKDMDDREWCGLNSD